MKARSCFAAAVLVLLPFGFLLSAEDKPTLVGDWKVTAGAMQGQPLNKNDFDGMRWLIGKDTLDVTPGRLTPAGRAGKDVLKGTYTVDATKTPTHLNWVMTAGDQKLSVDAIYELKGDVLRVCFPRRNAARPTGFDTKNQEWTMYEFERIKPEAAKE